MDTSRSRKATALISLGVLFFLSPASSEATPGTRRGDAKEPNTADPTSSSDQTGSKGEISRCNHVPNTNTNRVLCLCNNGVDLTAEVDYALEGVVDIQAAGGDGAGTSEAGKIREVLYGATKTVTNRVTTTKMVTTTTVTFCASAVSVAPGPSLTATIKTTTESMADVSGTLSTGELASATQPSPSPSPSPPPSSSLTPPTDEDEPDTDESSEGQDEEDETAIHREPVPRKGAHHGFAKIKAAQVPLNLDNSEARAQFGTVAQELDQVGVLPNDPDAYQDPYLEQELAGMVNIEELQAYADEAEIEAEGDRQPNNNDKHNEEDYDDEEDFRRQ
ncbi:hypothetical protein BGX29_009306 [Mortierella sp. GBA35]|nr:hypothetical protein BGX29_009306 [Mortierella sp. GBA35]